MNAKVMNIVALIFCLHIAITLTQISSHDERKPYIVYMGESPTGAQLEDLHNQYHNLLTEAIGDENTARSSRIHSYGKVINGFAANLLPEEVKYLQAKEEILSVIPNTIRKLATTRSWDFLGMSENTTRQPKSESNIIVGLLDTGIYMDAPSFRDEGYGPRPAKWKGKCNSGTNFTGCNRKVIGAKYFNLGNMDMGMEPTPVDMEGHGSHTASTAAGATVHSASLYGLANGTARGGVPGARIAMYKVCGSIGCSNMNIMAGFDDAIDDGVDLLSISIGGPAMSFFDDVMAIGSFHAMKRGILTVCAAGNDGPSAGTVANIAPWIFTVGATSLDRQFTSKLKLGDGSKFDGISINTFTMKKGMYPLISSDMAYNATSSPFGNASQCEPNSLSESKVKGKIVLCLGNKAASYDVKSVDASGAIVSLDDVSNVFSSPVIPATFVDSNIGYKIGKYINSTKDAKAIIYKSTTIQTTNKAPIVAQFSSRGPQLVARNILKPDIAAPGLNILAAFSKLVSISEDLEDNRHSVFNIISGTSMACPHVAGAAAYVKSFHPEWSPAAIKSALMTTAKPVVDSGIENPLDSGAGLLNPVEATQPGLIYELGVKDYIQYLCKEGYNSTTLALLVGGKNPGLKCSNFRPTQGIDGINYPTMHVQLWVDDNHVSVVFHRTVTYVGSGPTTFMGNVEQPKGISIKLNPDVLEFTKTGEKKSFQVEIKGAITEGSPSIPATYLEWSDSNHRVRSPIVIYKPTV